MTDSASRVRKHAERVRELVAAALRNIKDPRLGMITITDTRITPDLREATVYYTVLGDVEQQAATAAGLESAKGLLRSTVGRALGLRHSPSLTFEQDVVQDNVRHIDELLAAAHESDAKVHALAAQATYAGEAQPYRVSEEPHESGDDDAGEG